MSEASGPGWGQGQLFLECDRNGQVLWMNERARLRLSPMGNIVDALPASARAAFRSFLHDPSSQRSWQGVLPRAGQADVPARFSCLLALGDRRVLALELWERSADRDRENLEALLALQQRALLRNLRLRRLSTRLHGAQARVRSDVGLRLEQERTRIARELHSGAGQTLAGIKIHLELIQQVWAGAPPAAQASLNKIGILAQEALNQLRSVSHRLHPPAWETMRLREALENLWTLTGIPERFQAELHLATLAVEPPQPLRVALYRAAQEALSNVVRHSGATHVRLFLEEIQGRIHLSVEDDGQGFDPQSLAYGQPGASTGIGLRAIRDQVRALRGEFVVETGPNGTKLKVSLPVNTNERTE